MAGAGVVPWLDLGVNSIRDPGERWAAGEVMRVCGEKERREVS